MRMRIRHRTRFGYSPPAFGSFNEARLTPRSDEHQNLLSFHLETLPAAKPTVFRDHFGTLVYAFNVWQPHSELLVTGDDVRMDIGLGKLGGSRTVLVRTGITGTASVVGPDAVVDSIAELLNWL